MGLPYIPLEDHTVTTFTWYVHFPLAGPVLKGPPPKTPNEIYSTATRELTRRKHAVWATLRDSVKRAAGMVIAIRAPLSNKKLFRQAVERGLWLQLRCCLDAHFSVKSYEEAVSEVGAEYANEECKCAAAEVSALRAIYQDSAAWLDGQCRGR